MELLETNIYTYWLAYSAFVPKRSLFCRYFFINEDKTKYVSFRIYPFREYQPLLGFGFFMLVGGSKATILNDEYVYGLAEDMPNLRDDKFSTEPFGGSECNSGAFRLNVTESLRMPVLYFDTQYITLTQLDFEYLARIYNVVKQQLRNLIPAMPDVLSYVTTAFTSVTYIEPVPNDSKQIEYVHLYPDVIAFV